MATSKKTLADFQVPASLLKEEFEHIMETRPQFDDLRHIFNIAIDNICLFPDIKSVTTYQNYLERWVNGYCEALNNPPSQRTAKPKSSCSDPAIATIVQYATNATTSEIEKQCNHHNLFMSAENAQGNLLEEYIAKSIRPYGWLWCSGTVLRSIDFCTIDGSALLQVKNKYNTENSSSSAIRIGTTIQKWFRLGVRRRNGVQFPSYKWEKLNTIINAHTSNCKADCNMTEEGYGNFLRRVVACNPNIITHL